MAVYNSSGSGGVHMDRAISGGKKMPKKMPAKKMPMDMMPKKATKKAAKKQQGGY